MQTESRRLDVYKTILELFSNSLLFGGLPVLGLGLTCDFECFETFSTSSAVSHIFSLFDLVHQRINGRMTLTKDQRFLLDFHDVIQERMEHCTLAAGINCRDRWVMLRTLEAWWSSFLFQASRMITNFSQRMHHVHNLARALIAILLTCTTHPKRLLNLLVKCPEVQIGQVQHANFQHSISFYIISCHFISFHHVDIKATTEEPEKHLGFSEEDLAEEKGLGAKENMLIKKPSFKVEIPNIANIFFMKLILKPQVKFEICCPLLLPKLAYIGFLQFLW